MNQAELINIIESYLNGNISHACEEMSRLDGYAKAEMIDVAQEFFGADTALAITKSFFKKS